MTPFKKIAFDEETGKLSIQTTGTPLYDEVLLDNPIWIKIYDGWKIDINHRTDTPTYKAKLPFGIIDQGNTDMMDMKFGKFNNTIPVELNFQEENNNTNTRQVKIGVSGEFYLGFIGTDDLRNGKVNNGGFNIHNKDVYLNILKEGNKYFLEVGYNQL